MMIDRAHESCVLHGGENLQVAESEFASLSVTIRNKSFNVRGKCKIVASLMKALAKNKVDTLLRAVIKLFRIILSYMIKIKFCKQKIFSSSCRIYFILVKYNYNN